MPGEWKAWGAGQQGGLRFLADCLRLSSSGSLQVMALKEGESWLFRARLGLRGLIQGRGNE
jgi:hypothetical protein